MSQIHYAHPANTQRWRLHASRFTEKIYEQLQVEEESRTKNTAEPVFSPSKRVENSESPSFSIVETRIPLDTLKNGTSFEPIQIVNVPETKNDECTYFIIPEISHEKWTEKSFVIAKTFELPVSENVPRPADAITPETLLEKPSDWKNKQEKTPFSLDFSQNFEKDSSKNQNETINASPLMDISVPISVSLGRTRLPLTALLGLQVGSFLNLGQKKDAKAEVFINGGCAGNGFPVEYEDCVGVKLEELRK